jgi:class 3 adenylate cyclase
VAFLDKDHSSSDIAAMAKGTAPLVFVAYSRETEVRDRRILKLVQDLRLYGINATYGPWISPIGRDHCREEEDTIRRSDFVILALTPSYKPKWDDRNSGMAAEVNCIRNHAKSKEREGKSVLIPFVLEGKRTEVTPLSIEGLTNVGKGSEQVEHYDDAVHTCAAHILDLIPANLVRVPHHDLMQVPQRPIPLPRTPTLADAPEPSDAGSHSQGADTITGMILVAEINKFTELESPIRRQAVRNLWELHRSLGKERLPNVEMFADNMVDGIVIGFGHGSGQQPGNIIDFAEALITRFRTSADLALRVGVHFGSFDKMNKPAPHHCEQCRKNDGYCIWMFGRGPNTARRVASYASEKQIAITEAAIDHWLEQTDTGERSHIASSLYPRFALRDDPIARSQSAFQLQYGNTQPLLFRLRPVEPSGVEERIYSPKLMRLSHVESTINGVLDGIAATVGGWIGVCGGPRAASTRPRVSMFVKESSTDGSTMLVCYKHRAMKKPASGPDAILYETHRKPGKTRYATAGSGMGPAGYAFYTQQPFYLPRLSNPRNKKKYAADLKTRAHLTDEQIDGFGRKATTFMAFPILLPSSKDHTAEAEGAVCIDLMADPPEAIDDHMDEMLTDLHEHYSTQLAALWMYRAYGQ